MTELSDAKKGFIVTAGNALALGGPGCGKTFAALLKSGHEIKCNKLETGQKILFLSFARATVARVEQQARKLLGETQRSVLQIDTYHAFSWNLLRSHGYLLNGKKTIRLLPPPEAAAKLSGLEPSAKLGEKIRLFEEEGLLHFDLFSKLAAALLVKSGSLTRILCDAYPIIILDEFQDTNSDEWNLIRNLGRRSRLIALADAEQRIYEFRGADPKRISEFIDEFHPTRFDFNRENHRSGGTDITVYGSDLLTGANKGKRYNNVVVVRYRFRKGNGLHLDLKSEVLQSIRRQSADNTKDWSVALLVPTRRLMLEISDYLGMEQLFGGGRKLPAVMHEVALETAGPCLSAVLIGALLDCGGDSHSTATTLVKNLCSHLRGRKGDDAPTQLELNLGRALEAFVETGQITGSKRKLVVERCFEIAERRQALTLSGDPLEDWLSVRRLLEGSALDCINQVAEDARYLRLLHKGANLRSRLAELWRAKGTYRGAEAAVRDAILQEHFATSTRTWTGVHVMTMHKSKGKEFDEVLIYEGQYQGRIVRPNSTEKDVAQARLALRVAVTRAMKRATIFTPIREPCRFL